jgi:PRC-barrel domain
MAKATAHPDHRLISSEDVQGTLVYGAGDEEVGEIDHLLIEKVSGRVLYAVMSFGGFLGLGHSHYLSPGRHSSTTLTWAAIAQALPRKGYAMLLNSVTTRGKIVTGRPEPTNTMAFPVIGAPLRDVEQSHLGAGGRTHEPAAIILLPLWWPMR